MKTLKLTQKLVEIEMETGKFQTVDLKNFIAKGKIIKQERIANNRLINNRIPIEEVPK